MSPKNSFQEQPSFFSLYTMPGDAQTLVLELPKSFFNTSDEPRPVIFSATYARAAWDDESSLLLLHEPAETTDHVVFAFNVTADGTGVDLIRKQYGVRTSSPDDSLSVQLGALSARVTTLPILIDHRHGDEPSYVVDASELVAQGFFITDVAAAADVRLRTDLCRAFPTNMDITAEYLLPVDPEDPASPLVNEVIAFSMALLPEVCTCVCVGCVCFDWACTYTYACGGGFENAVRRNLTPTTTPPPKQTKPTNNNNRSPWSPAPWTSGLASSRSTIRTSGTTAGTPT